MEAVSFLSKIESLTYHSSVTILIINIIDIGLIIFIDTIETHVPKLR